MMKRAMLSSSGQHQKEYFLKKEALKKFYDVRNTRACELLDKEDGGSLLDVGASSLPIKNIISKKWDVTDLDLWGDKDCIIADINNGLPFENESFDAVHAGELIEHVIYPPTFLMEVRRILKPDGVLVLTTPNLFYWRNRLSMLRGEGNIIGAGDDYEHYHIFSSKSLTTEIEKNGFVVEKNASSYLIFSRHDNPRILQYFGSILGNMFKNLSAHVIIKARKRI